MGSVHDDGFLSFHDEAVRYYADDIARICANVREFSHSDLKADPNDYIDPLFDTGYDSKSKEHSSEGDGEVSRTGDYDDDDIRYDLSDEPEDIRFSLTVPEISFEKDDEKRRITEDYYSWEKKNASYNSFSAEFNEYFVKSKFSSDEFFRRSNIDRKLLSKIRTDYTYHPSKLTVIRACFGLGLGLDESLALLETAGYTLSSSSSFDLAIRYCLIKELSDIEFINDILKELDEEMRL